MGQNSKIEWTHHTFNPWRGCTKVSAGCANCYAETQSKRNTKTLGIWGANGTRVVASESMWNEPLKWNRHAGICRGCGWNREYETGMCPTCGVTTFERPRVFCASMADVFEDWTGPMLDAKGNILDSDRSRPTTTTSASSYDPLSIQDVRNRLFRLIDATPNLDWLLLTKRPENVNRMMPAYHSCGLNGCEVLHIRPNVWMGTSVENQQAADQRIPHLLRIPARVRFLSVEPLLGPVNLYYGLWSEDDRAKMDRQYIPGRHDKVDWVIVGGESGHHARPMHPDWVREIRDMCRESGTAFHFKQWGEWAINTMAPAERTTVGIRWEEGMLEGVANEIVMYKVGKKEAGRILDGRTWDEFPLTEEQGNALAD